MHRRAVEPLWDFAVAVRLLSVCVVMGCLLAWSGQLGAQTAVDGALAGRVVLPAFGGDLTGVRVRLTVADGDAVVRETTVARDGSFLLLRVVPGEYRAEVVAGAQVEAAAQVQVELGGVAEVVLRGASEPGGRQRALLPAAVVRQESETLSPALEGPGMAQSDVHDQDERVADSTREDFDDGRAERRQSGTNPSVATLLSFRGLAPTQNVSLLDGVSGDQEFRGGGRGNAPGGPRTQSSFGSGSVRAFRVAAHNYAAQYGGGASGLVAAVSRGGGPVLHGGGYYTARTSAFDAANPFSVVTHYRDGVVTNSLVKPEDLLQLIGGRVGGPLMAKRRVFGFAAVDQQWRNFPAMGSPNLASFYAPTPTQVALLGTRGVSVAATQAALNYLDGLGGEVARRADHAQQFARLDWQASLHDHLSLSFARGRLNSPAGTGSGASTAVVARGRASVGDETIRTEAATARWLRFFSPRFTSELRAQYAHDVEFERARPPLAQEPGIGPGGFAPEVNIAGGEFLYGTPAALGRNAYPDETRLQVAEVAQVAARRHLVTLGGEWSSVDERVDALNNVEGTFTYDSGATGGRAGGLVDWITDYTFGVNAYPNGACPSINATVHLFCFRSYAQSFGQQAVDFTLHSFAGFVQDLWRVRRGLTLEFGARYEYTLLPLPQSPNLALDAAFGAMGTTSTFPEDRNNVGPRVAVAWQSPWATVRVGYGAYFGRLPGSTVRAALLDTALASTVTRVRITPQTVTACPQVVNQGFGYPCAYVSAPPAAVAATTSALLFAKNFRLPAVQQAELTLERELGRRTYVRATYSTALATQLPNSTDINIAASAELRSFVLQGGDGRVGARDGETFVVPAYTARVAPQFGPVTAVLSNANATWHGLTVEGRVRGWHGLEAHGGYTWSKALDFGAEQSTTPRVNGQFDPFHVRYDKARADADFPHRFTGDVAYELRLQRGSRRFRQALDGWRAGALASAGSSRPYSYEIFGGTRLSGGAESINGAGGSAYLPTAGRNTLRLPLRWNVDARVGRAFKVTEKLHGEGYVEALNVANHRNATRVNARAFLVGTAANGVTPLVFQSTDAIALEGLNTPAFGTITSSSAGAAHERALQFGVRLRF